MLAHELPQAGLKADLLDVLRAQPLQRAAQGEHHPLLQSGDLRRVDGDILVLLAGAVLDDRGEGRRRRQDIGRTRRANPAHRASLVLLHLEEPRHQRLARGSRGGEVLGKVVDRPGDVIEFSGAIRQRSATAGT